MFSDDSSIENFKQLFLEFRKYIELQKEFTKLEIVEKLTKLFSTLIMIVILIGLGLMALFYMLFALAYLLAPCVGGLPASFGIIVLILVVICAIIALFRKELIIKPIVNFLANLFLNSQKK